MEKATQKTVKLNMGLTHEGKSVDLLVKIDATVLGYLCVHPSCELVGNEVVTTDTWTVSHLATGRGACGRQTFQSRAQAVKFMRLLEPLSPLWRGDNQYRIAANTVNLYQAAVISMRARDPEYSTHVWMPVRGDKVIVITTSRVLRTRTAAVHRVTGNDEDEVRIDDLVFHRSPTGAWRAAQQKDATVALIPYSTANVQRFMKEKPNVNHNGPPTPPSHRRPPNSSPRSPQGKASRGSKTGPSRHRRKHG
jgi:hypothetical protein